MACAVTGSGPDELPSRSGWRERHPDLVQPRFMMRPNYRMKLTRLGRRFSRRPDTPPLPGWVAVARLGLQLMRDR